MLKELPIKTTTYEAEGYPGYCIQADEKEDSIEFVLFHKNYGIRCEMFGLPTGKMTQDEMLSIVEANLDEKICNYQEDFVDRDEYLGLYSYKKTKNKNIFKKSTVKTTTYEAEEYPGYYIQVDEKEDSIEFVLYHKNYGIRCEMYGLPKGDLSYEAMLTFIENNLVEHILDYQEEYIDMDDWLDLEDCEEFEENENDDDDIHNIRMEDYGLDVEYNFFNAPMCPCGCGGKAQISMETEDDILNVLCSLLLMNKCKSCAVFYKPLEGEMKAVMKKDDKCMHCNIKPEHVYRLDLFASAFDIHQYALFIEATPGSWHVVDK